MFGLRSQDGQAVQDLPELRLADSWTNQSAIDAHHASPKMAAIPALREKYDLYMTVERYLGIEENSTDERKIRK